MKKMVLSYLVAVTAGCLVFSAFSSDKVKIGFIVKQPEESWFQLEWKFAGECARDKGFTLVKIGATDGQQVLSAIDNLGAQGAQGFVICTPDVKLGPAIKAKADMNSMKVISVDDRFLNADGTPMKDVPYFGFSCYNLGKNVGNAAFAELKKRNWDIKNTGLLAVTYDELTAAKDRVQGAIDALKASGFPTAQIYCSPMKTTDVSGGFDAANAELTKHPDIKHWIVVALNDESVVGAVRAIEGRKVDANNIIGIGINGDATAITEFKKDKPTGFYASMLMNAKLHGYRTSEMLYNWIANKQAPPMETFTNGVLFDRNNYQQILKEQGLSD